MNETKLKELFSVNYIKTIAEYVGYSTKVPSQDFGTDLEIDEITYFPPIGNLPSGRSVSLQIKSVSTKNIRLTEQFAYYDLAVRNYNILSRRYENARLQGHPPYYLIVVILPVEKADWLTFSVEQYLLLQVKAYWYLPTSDTELSMNKSTKRIEISLSNQIDLQTFPNFFNLDWSQKQYL